MDWTDQEIHDLYKEHGSVKAIMDITGLSRSEVSGVVAEMPDRAKYRRQAGIKATYSTDKLISDMQTAADVLGEPLSGLKYQSVAKELGLAAYYTQKAAFGGWDAACAAAGIAYNPPRGRRPDSITLNDCIIAIEQCFLQFQRRVSYDTYALWARNNEFPSGPSVRLHGRWSDIAAIAENNLIESGRLLNSRHEANVP